MLSVITTTTLYNATVRLFVEFELRAARGFGLKSSNSVRLESNSVRLEFFVFLLA